MKQISFLFFICLLFILPTKAQTSDANKANGNTQTTKRKLVKAKIFPKEGSLESKFDYIVDNSGKYQIYRVIKIDWLADMKKNLADSSKINKENKEILVKKIDKQEKEIDKLKNELDSIKQDLDISNENKDTFQIFGININKSIMWIINSLFLLSAIALLLMFKRSNAVTQETKESLDHINKEFESHRKRALEKEQILARKLHDATHK